MAWSQDSWHDAQQAFLGAAAAAGAHVDEIALPGLADPVGRPLSIAIASLDGPDCGDQPRRVMIHSAGVHGAEGYAGSATQVAFLRQAAIDKFVPAAGTRIFLVHVVNPYGMAHGRRWNENGVDLNRNSRTAAELRAHKNPGYMKVADLVNPEAPDGCCSCFLMQAAWNIAIHGYGALKLAIAGGQVQLPGGLFFIGREPQRTPSLVLRYLREHGVSRANGRLECCTHVDFHTGLGAFGVDTLLLPPSVAGDAALVRRTLDLVDKPGRVELAAPGQQQAVAYHMPGDFAVAVRQLVPDNCRYMGMTQEFGTYPALEVFKRLRQENVQLRVAPTTPLDHPTRVAALRAFYPDSDKWRQAVLARGLTVLRQLIAAAGLGAAAGMSTAKAHRAVAPQFEPALDTMLADAGIDKAAAGAGAAAGGAVGAGAGVEDVEFSVAEAGEAVPLMEPAAAAAAAEASVKHRRKDD